ncbi:MAG: tetratricopeptide repeat protein [Aurantimonas endophytica]|uniref:Flp pilus assembly protein TadD n=1 Tax=Aurantimonas endophytica TaxID=1522175 RepID=A0A7W6HAW4_9HYPH|nr:tetratricopeptide repeat protein [Aurantimonas endophytica]MBB4001796.1 Flp pilus assembly protein TadD [Aurantimonas endophytica]MCO6402567.1 tetratricopeptide repeat protein [Aurantimonas endophytica]
MGMHPRQRRSALAAFAMLVAAALIVPTDRAAAVFSGEMSPTVRSGDSDYADGVEAFEDEDWPAAITALAKVVERRPHHDNAWSLLGYSLRKSGNHERALDAYGRALSINPHHRGAMAYLGEAYLDLDRVRDAKILLIRLATECRRVALTFSDGNFQNGCGEYATLKQSIESYEIDPAGRVEPVAQRW